MDASRGARVPKWRSRLPKAVRANLLRAIGRRKPRECVRASRIGLMPEEVLQRKPCVGLYGRYALCTYDERLAYACRTQDLSLVM
jgi:hypothetical protein